ncbi:MAG: purine-nucleoside phosphorylase [Candidatus Eremiobacteraeota bacterium]|nr:purine-nucleoside phosphorylase [Candidatus Eremiobacteraeota bacterium]
MKELRKQMNEAAGVIRKKSNDFKPDIGLILGSGLGVLADEIEDAYEIPYEEIPGMKISTVKGHAGSLFLGKLAGKKVMAFKGRIHYYEGYSMKDITFPVRLMQAMGVSFMVITNACGGIREDLKTGDLVIIDDHINMMGDNPLIGTNDPDLGPRFPDMSNSYDRDLKVIASKAYEDIGMIPKLCVYSAVTGPNYETYAEVQHLRIIGTDTIGMSTVPEVITAAHAGIRTLGISCVTDVLHEPGTQVTHEEVLQVANENRPIFLKLMKKIVSRIPVKSKFEVIS